MENVNEEVENVNAQAEEIPPVAPEAPNPNFTEGQGAGYAGSANSYATTDNSDEVGKILGIVSLVTGILSLLCCCIWGLSIVCAIAAIVTGIISLKKSSVAKGLAIAGIACGGVGLVIAICMLAFAGLAAASDQIVDELENYL